MAAGKAVIASANGETASLIKEADCGMCAGAQDAKALAAVADKMAASGDFARYGANSKKYYDRYFTKKNHVDLIEKMLSQTK